MIHQWFRAPSIIGQHSSFNMFPFAAFGGDKPEPPVKLVVYQCSVCGKRVVGKKPSYTERCMRRFR